jgi:hypothetical protein
MPSPPLRREELKSAPHIFSLVVYQRSKEAAMSPTKPRMVTGMFRDHHDAQQAYQRLLDRGFASNEVNVLMSDASRSHYTWTENQAPIEAKNEAAEGVGVGGAIGTAVGATLAALVAIGTTVVVPPLGIVVAGPLAAAFAGGGAGAVAGGIIGGLVGMGIPEPSAQAYQEALRVGGVVLGVVPRSAQDSKEIEGMFKELGGENVCYS